MYVQAPLWRVVPVSAFRPKDVAERLGVSPATLRRWSDAFADSLSDAAGRTLTDNGNAGQRRYTEVDVAILTQAKALLNEGHSYEEARARLPRDDALAQAAPMTAQGTTTTALVVSEEALVALRSLEAALQAKDQSIAALEGTLRAKEEALTAKQAIIDALSQTLDEKETLERLLEQERTATSREWQTFRSQFQGDLERTAGLITSLVPQQPPPENRSLFRRLLASLGA